MVQKKNHLSTTAAATTAAATTTKKGAPIPIPVVIPPCPDKSRHAHRALRYTYQIEHPPSLATPTR